MKARISCRSLASVAVQFAQPYQLIVAVECIIGISVILVVHAGAPPCPADRQGGLFGPRRSVRVPHDQPLPERRLATHRRTPSTSRRLSTLLYNATDDRGRGLPGTGLLEQMGNPHRKELT